MDSTATHLDIITTLVALPPCAEGQQPAQRVTNTTQNIRVCPLPPLEHNAYMILLLCPFSGIHARCPAVSIPAQLVVAVLLHMHNDNQRLFYSILFCYTDQHITLSCCTYLDVQMEELKLEALNSKNKQQQESSCFR